MFALEIREEIDSAVSHYRETLPSNVKQAIQLCTSHLYHGPLYFDSEGNECSCFDIGAKQFNWNPSLALISEWAESISDLSVETSFDFETEESEYESVDGTRAEILRAIVGKELTKYL
jgi:hypothetical protein